MIFLLLYKVFVLYESFLFAILIIAKIKHKVYVTSITIKMIAITQDLFNIENLFSFLLYLELAGIISSFPKLKNCLFFRNY